MIHMICVDIAGMTQKTYEVLYAYASAERKAKADRALLKGDKQRCITADAILRYVAGKELGVSRLSVGRNGFGKPVAKDMDSFHFNLSYSGRWVVMAYGDSEVGVSVEKMQEAPSLDKDVHQFLAKEEAEFVFYSAEKQAARFSQIRTAKESYLKYLGTGFQRPRNSINVLAADMPRLYSRTLEGGYCMTLCAKDQDLTLDQMTVNQLLQMMTL